MMFRLIFIAIVVMIIISWLFSKRLPWLEKLGLTKLNSSVSFRLFGRERHVPVTYLLLIAVATYFIAAYLYHLQQ